MIVLETERLIIRDHIDTDLHPMHLLLSNGLAMSYLPETKTTSLEETATKLETAVAESNLSNRVKYYLAIIMRETQEYVGEVGFTVTLNSPAGKIANLGYFILPEYWGQGIVTEAAREVVRFGFEEVGVIKFEAGCTAENRGSERVMQKLGMVKEAQHKLQDWHGGRLKDRVEYRLLKAEWLQPELSSLDLQQQILEFVPANDQEQQDKKVILDYIAQYPHNILLRDNEFAHITSSGFVMNRELDKVLMVHHNIRNTWAWTGGHVDGDGDFLKVAIKEAKEETGILEATPLTEKIVSLDVLPVFGHTKHGKHVSSHLHLSIAYILIASEEEVLQINKDENTGVSWFPIAKFTEEYFSTNDVYLYGKLIRRAKEVD